MFFSLITIRGYIKRQNKAIRRVWRLFFSLITIRGHIKRQNKAIRRVWRLKNCENGEEHELWREKVSWELRAKLHFVLGEQRKVLRYPRREQRSWTIIRSKDFQVRGAHFHAFIWLLRNFAYSVICNYLCTLAM